MIPSWAPWVGCAVLAIGGYAVYERGSAQLAACEQRMADFKKDLAIAAAEQKAAVAKASAEAAQALLAESQQIKASAADEKEKVRVVTVTLPCQQDPGINAMFDAADRLLFGAGPGAGEGVGRPAAASGVRGSGSADPAR